MSFNSLKGLTANLGKIFCISISVYSNTNMYLFSFSDMLMEESQTTCLSMSWKIPSPCPHSPERVTSAPVTLQPTYMSCASPTQAFSSLSPISTESPGHFSLQTQWYVTWLNPSYSINTQTYIYRLIDWLRWTGVNSVDFFGSWKMNVCVCFPCRLWRPCVNRDIKMLCAFWRKMVRVSGLCSFLTFCEPVSVLKSLIDLLSTVQNI